MRLPIISIDANNYIAILENNQLKMFDIIPIINDFDSLFKKYAYCSCMLIKNNNPTYYENLIESLIRFNIQFECVDKNELERYHNLAFPKGKGERGMRIEYERLKVLKDDQKRLPIHLSIQRKVQNDIVWSDNVKHLLKTSGRKQARKCLGDDFWHFSILDLRNALNEIESEIDKIKAKELYIKSNRHKTKAQQYVPNIKVELKMADAILLLIYQKYNQCQD